MTLDRILEGSWDLVTTYHFITGLITLLITPLNGLKGVTPIINRVITPVTNSY